jgi:cell wall-associated NlpC family hydrolase
LILRQTTYNKTLLRVALGFFFLVSICLKAFAQNKQETIWLVSPTDFFSGSNQDFEYDDFKPVAVWDEILNKSTDFLGVPYHYSGTGSPGFDCSGFVQKVFSLGQLKLPHSSGMIANMGDALEVANVQKGDLLFFTGRNASKKEVGHLGIVFSIKDKQVKMIHAAVTGGVRIDRPFEIDYYKDRFLFARRIVLPVSF